jgi:hypothetical protein
MELNVDPATLPSRQLPVHAVTSMLPTHYGPQVLHATDRRPETFHCVGVVKGPFSDKAANRPVAFQRDIYAANVETARADNG